jgi:hypothetical protein
MKSVKLNFQTKTVSRLIFHGVGDGCEKCVSCVEILKKAINEPLYQWNCLTTKKIPGDNIEDAAAEKCIPEIFVMISREQYPEEYRSSRYIKKCNKIFNPYL